MPLSTRPSWPGGEMLPQPDNRRPLKSRGAAWARSLAAGLARGGGSPDIISAFSLTFAILGATLFFIAGTAAGVMRGVLLLLAALCIQLRLVCNLLDGMVAVEHGKGSSAGPIWNELPDRFADTLFLVSAGYAADLGGVHGAAVAGWLAAVGALICAYVRELGRGLGFPADFSGPMAKPQRMAAPNPAPPLGAHQPP